MRDWNMNTVPLPSAVSQVPVLLQANVVPPTNDYIGNFNGQSTESWSPPVQRCYGAIRAPGNIRSSDPPPNTFKPDRIPGPQEGVPHPDLPFNVEVLVPSHASETPETEKQNTDTLSSPKQASPPAKKRKRSKKPPLKTILNPDLPTMVPPLIDTTERQFHCPDCPRKFLRQFKLDQHSRIHSGQRPYACPDCEQSYTRREHLQRHLRIHTGERPFECDDCDKKYRRKSQLVRHARVHTGERPYECKACDKSFRRRGHMLRHFKVHSVDVLKEAGIDMKSITQATKQAKRSSKTRKSKIPEETPDEPKSTEATQLPQPLQKT